MSIKKLLILAAAGIAAVSSAAALAGGPDQMEPQSMFAPAIYVDAHGGYALYNWNRFINSSQGNIWFTPQGMKNNQGGGIGGMDVGLQIFKNIAVEVGGFYLPEVTGIGNQTNDITTPTCGGGTGGIGACRTSEQYNWMAYAAGRFNVHMPYVDGLDMFAKLGAVWRGMSNKYYTSRGFAGMHSWWSVLFGAGFSYDIMQTGFNVGVQWLFIPQHLVGMDNGSAGEDDAANHSQAASRQPAFNLLTGSVGYRFDF